MKKYLLNGILLLISLSLIAQAPDFFNYQAVIRNSGGDLVTNQNIGFRISILQGNEPGTSVYSETHTVLSNSYGVCNLSVGSGSDKTGDINTISWSEGPYFLKLEVDIEGGTNYVQVGSSELLFVPTALYSKNTTNAETADLATNATNAQHSETAGSAANALHATTSDTANIAKFLDADVLFYGQTDTLFAVKDYDGNIVFAVFPDGAQVYVSDLKKGNVGGFAVSGRGTSKGDINYLTVTPDSTCIYINESVKGQVGGFAVSGRGTGKGIYSDYFNISGVSVNTEDTIKESEARMLWYPKSEAFLVGRVLIEHPDSVGLNSVATGFESKAIGDYSQALGYQSVARNDYSTAIGKNATAHGANSFAFGNLAFAIGENSYAIGSGALAKGINSFALGSVGVDTLGNIKDSPKALGDFSFAMGLGTRSSGLSSVSIGANNISVGDFSTSLGFTSTATGNRSIAIGAYSRTYGVSSTAIGYKCITNEDGYLSFAGGISSTTSGYGAVALGINCDAIGNRSLALGDGAEAKGFSSVAIGDGARADTSYSNAFGYYLTASGKFSYAFGKWCDTNKKNGAFVFNTTSNKFLRLNASQDYEMSFRADNGFRFFTTDTSDINSFIMLSNGNVGMGTKTPEYRLEVAGDINVHGIIYQAGGQVIPDYVFENTYTLESIEEHAEFMWREKHLPALKSAKQIEAEGKINLNERREQMLEELEKAHIYIEQLNERIKILEAQNEILKQNLELQKRVEELEQIIKK